MLFNSLEFVVFFPLVVGAYFLTPYKYRWILLLIASYYFYMVWNPIYIILIILSTVIDYFVSLKMGYETEKKNRKKYLYISLFSNLGLLFIFKYLNFFGASINILRLWFGITNSLPQLNILLPMGISFYTFQTLSYTIDVYNGKIKPEKHFGIFALYVSFFPQLVAGPIERPGHLIPQFKTKHSVDYERITSGLKKMGVGFFKKIVIADRLAIFVNSIYSNPMDNNGLPLVVATIFFSFQIYCDFSGYSDIAIGASKVMGFDLMENFRNPYIATSISDFWNRWHISLSTWFKDYVYIPLGGNKVTIKRYNFNLIVTFLVSGLWHGANWTFVIWGIVHGLYIIIEKKLGRLKIFNFKNENNILVKAINMITTFGMVSFAWIFFRANNIGDAIYIIKNLFVDINRWGNLSYVSEVLSDKGLNNFEFLFSIIVIVLLMIANFLEKKTSFIESIDNFPIFIRWSIYYSFIVLVLVMGVTENAGDFIYFQF